MGTEIDGYLTEWYGELNPEVCMAPEHYCQRVAEFEAQPICENAVVLLGDSLTEFADWNHLLQGQILNRGIAGDMIEGMTLRLDELVRHTPSKIFLMAGCNNFVKHPSITVAQVWSAYCKLLAALAETLPSAKIFVAGTLPLNPVSGDYYEGINRKILDLNTLLRNHSYPDKGSVVSKGCLELPADSGFNEAHCVHSGCFDSSAEQSGCVEYLFYDVAPELSDSRGFLRADLTIDGCHLNSAGYRIWASRIISL